MTDRIVGKLGKLAPERPAGLHMLAFYQENPLPVAPATVEVPNVKDWGMLGNNKYGDCTFAGIVHARMANAAFLGLTENFPDDATVEASYLSYTDGQDTGAVEAAILKFWQTTGLFGNKLHSFAPTDFADQDELRSVIASYGLAYIGVKLPTVALQQFADNQPWDLTHTPADNNIDGGHCVILVGYNKDYAQCITWGKVQQVSWAWLTSYMEESWALITTEIVEKGEYGNMRLADLTADLEKLS
jgi:hypothetical protein